MKNFRQYLRKQKHKSYVESRVVQLRSQITMEAIENGCVDENTRQLFLKYNEYLKSL